MTQYQCYLNCWHKRKKEIVIPGWKNLLGSEASRSNSSRRASRDSRCWISRATRSHAAVALTHTHKCYHTLTCTTHSHSQIHVEARYPTNKFFNNYVFLCERMSNHNLLQMVPVVVGAVFNGHVQSLGLGKKHGSPDPLQSPLELLLAVRRPVSFRPCPCRLLMAFVWTLFGNGGGGCSDMGWGLIWNVFLKCSPTFSLDSPHHKMLHWQDIDESIRKVIGL